MKNIKYVWLSVILVIMIGLFTQLVVASDAIPVSSNKDIVLSLVNQDPDPATTGDVVEFRIGIENWGAKAAEDVILSLGQPYGVGKEATVYRALDAQENEVAVKFLRWGGTSFRSVRRLRRVDNSDVSSWAEFSKQAANARKNRGVTIEELIQLTSESTSAVEQQQPVINRNMGLVYEYKRA